MEDRACVIDRTLQRLRERSDRGGLTALYHGDDVDVAGGSGDQPEKLKGSSAHDEEFKVKPAFGKELAERRKRSFKAGFPETHMCILTARLAHVNCVTCRVTRVRLSRDA